MHKLALALLAAVSLAACDLENTTVKKLVEEANNAGAKLEALGAKPKVTARWEQGKLTRVRVTFPQVLGDKRLDEMAEKVRAVVTSEFSQTPEEILLTF